MIKKFKGLIIGILIGALLTSGMVFGKETSEMAELFYSNIKIFIDGGEIIPKDANGNAVEPFTLNGSTYLPVRAISNAFGKEVYWDGITQSIYIGKKDQTQPDNYLDKIQYNDYKEGSEGNDFTIINGTINDFIGNTYTSGLMFYIYNGGSHSYTAVKDDSDGTHQIIAYPLNSQYKNLKGKIVLPREFKISTWDDRENCNYENGYVNVLFYGDNRLIYKATAVTTSMPFTFDINTTGINQLSVKIFAEKGYTHVALTDLALYK